MKAYAILFNSKKIKEYAVEYDPGTSRHQTHHPIEGKIDWVNRDGEAVDKTEVEKIEYS